MMSGHGEHDAGLLHHIGFCSSLTAKRRADLTPKIEKLKKPTEKGGGFTGRAPGGPILFASYTELWDALPRRFNRAIAGRVACEAEVQERQGLGNCQKNAADSFTVDIGAKGGCRSAERQFRAPTSALRTRLREAKPTSTSAGRGLRGAGTR